MTSRALHILAAIALTLVSASMSARSVREVLGGELKIEHPGVTELHLNFKGIDDLDGLREVVTRYPDLRVLDLRYNTINEIPGGTFIGFSKLEALYLSYNAITNLSDGVNVITPAFLRAKEEGREQLVSSFAGLARLKDLLLSNNKLSSLPASLGALRALEVLSLSDNELIHLPKSFSRLVDLKELYLRKNQFAVVPRGIFLRFNKLEKLDLSENEMAHLYDGVQLQTVSTREAQGRGERVLWSSLAGLTSLKNLSLDINKLKRLPESFVELTTLEELKLNNNELSSLPQSFGRLTSLTKLFINANELSSLPESFGRLTDLYLLHAHDNQLSRLPESFGNLSALEILFLNDNSLSILPESFRNLKALSKLFLSDNKLSETYKQHSIQGATPLDKLLRPLPLTDIDLRGNGLDQEVIRAIRRARPFMQMD